MVARDATILEKEKALRAQADKLRAAEAKAKHHQDEERRAMMEIEHQKGLVIRAECAVADYLPEMMETEAIKDGERG